MLYSIGLFVASWIAFFLFADKKKFFQFASTGYFASILGLATDVLIHHYPLWEYSEENGMKTFLRHILDDPGIYFVTTYLFLQTLPKHKTFFTMSRHIFFWSTFAVSIEWLTIHLGFMKHQLWWNLGFSYLSDWFLFFLFYKHYNWWRRHN